MHFLGIFNLKMPAVTEGLLNTPHFLPRCYLYSKRNSRGINLEKGNLVLGLEY